MKLALAALVGMTLLLAGIAVAVNDNPFGGSERQRPGGPFVGSEPPARITMPTFALNDSNGRTLHSETFRGKVVVVTFLDTKCKDACPIIAGQLAHAWRLLSTAERRETRMVAISTDPRDDTPENVRIFLATHRARGVIHYLRGPLPVMRNLWRRFQILSSVASGAADIHSAPVRIYGRDGVWLTTQHAGADLTPRDLVHDVRIALRAEPR